uniref:uncharacterized protein n=1 Tax=Myxine glutinosa TaxID=7769 RepID=UPI00358E9A93
MVMVMVMESLKPLMEKRRRARINASLAQLKALVLDIPRCDKSRCSKLEKADILEMTVTHLQNLHDVGSQEPNTKDTPGESQAQFKAGFQACMTNVALFCNSSTQTQAYTSLLGHLQTHMENPDVTEVVQRFRTPQSESPVWLQASRLLCEKSCGPEKRNFECQMTEDLNSGGNMVDVQNKRCTLLQKTESCSKIKQCTGAVDSHGDIKTSETEESQDVVHSQNECSDDVRGVRSNEGKLCDFGIVGTGKGLGDFEMMTSIMFDDSWDSSKLDPLCPITCTFQSPNCPYVIQNSGFQQYICGEMLAFPKCWSCPSMLFGVSSSTSSSPPPPQSSVVWRPW